MTSIEGKTIQAPVTKVMSSHPGWQVLCYVIAAILLVAAVSKSYVLSTTPTMGDGIGDGILDNRLFQIAVVNFEIALSVWLIAGLMSRFSWLVTISCFSIFAMVSFYKAAVLHESSCGCFGAVQVNPWITTSLDLAIIGLLIVFRPKGILFHWKAFLQELPELKRFRRVGLVAVVWLVLAIPVSWTMVTAEFVELTSDTPLPKAEKNVVLRPFQWIDAEFPLLPYIDDATRKKLIIDRHRVVLFRFDCEECKQLIDGLPGKNEYVFIAILGTEDNLT